MASVIQNNFRVRKSFAKLKKVIDIPTLIDIQKRSYDKFLQHTIPPDKREDYGLQGQGHVLFYDVTAHLVSSLSAQFVRPRPDLAFSMNRAMP